MFAAEASQWRANQEKLAADKQKRAFQEEQAKAAKQKVIDEQCVAILKSAILSNLVGNRIDLPDWPSKHIHEQLEQEGFYLDTIDADAFPAWGRLCLKKTK